MMFVDNKKNIESGQPYPLSQTTLGNIGIYTDIYTCLHTCTYSMHTDYTCNVYSPSGGCSRLSKHVVCWTLTFDPGDHAVPAAVTMGTPLTIQRQILRWTKTERLRDNHTLYVLWLFGIWNVCKRSSTLWLFLCGRRGWWGRAVDLSQLQVHSEHFCITCTDLYMYVFICI